MAKKISQMTRNPSPATTDLLEVDAAGVTYSESNQDILNLLGSTNHALQVGNSTGSITSLGVATNGQIPIGSTGANPTLGVPTNGTNISWTTGAGTLQANISGTVSAGNGGTGSSGPTAHGILIGEGSSSVVSLVLGAGQIPIGTTSSDPSAATITSGTGITVTSATGSITVAVNGANPWVDETGSSVTMAVNTGYTSDDGASLVTFTLPATSAIGDWFEINGKGSGGWTIAQTSGQQIKFGNQATTSGASGSLASTNQFDCVRGRCLTANTIWTVVHAVGNLTVT